MTSQGAMAQDEAVVVGCYKRACALLGESRNFSGSGDQIRNEDAI